MFAFPSEWQGPSSSTYTFTGTARWDAYSNATHVAAQSGPSSSSYAHRAVAPPPIINTAISRGGQVSDTPDRLTRQQAEIQFSLSRKMRHDNEKRGWWLRCVRCVYLRHWDCNHESPCGRCQEKITLHGLTGQQRDSMCTYVVCSKYFNAKSCPLGKGKCHYLHKWQLEELIKSGKVFELFE